MSEPPSEPLPPPPQEVDPRSIRAPEKQRSGSSKDSRRSRHGDQRSRSRTSRAVERLGTIASIQNNDELRTAQHEYKESHKEILRISKTLRKYKLAKRRCEEVFFNYIRAHPEVKGRLPISDSVELCVQCKETTQSLSREHLETACTLYLAKTAQHLQHKDGGPMREAKAWGADMAGFIWNTRPKNKPKEYLVKKNVSTERKKA